MEIRLLEKIGALQILVYLQNTETEVLATDLVDNISAGPTTSYNAFNLLLKEGFIQEEWKMNPRRRVFTLTEKGFKVAEHLEKIEKGELGVKNGKGFYTYPNPEYLDPNFLNPSR